MCQCRSSKKKTYLKKKKNMLNTCKERLYYLYIPVYLISDTIIRQIQQSHTSRRLHITITGGLSHSSMLQTLPISADHCLAEMLGDHQHQLHLLFVLPNALRRCSSFNMFKSSLKTYLFNILFIPNCFIILLYFQLFSYYICVYILCFSV